MSSKCLNLWYHLQKDCCICSYGTVHLTFISISSPVGRRVCSIPLIVFYLLDCLYWWKYNVPCHNCIYNRLPEDEARGSKHTNDITLRKIKILIWKVCILLVWTVQLYSAFRKSLCTYKRCWICFSWTIVSKNWIKQLHTLPALHCSHCLRTEYIETTAHFNGNFIIDNQIYIP
jgi:hypothetical protein